MSVSLTPLGARSTLDPQGTLRPELDLVIAKEQRFDQWSYSDYDKAVLVTHLVILPAAALEDNDGDLGELFTLRVEDDEGGGYSTELLAVHDLGDD